MWCCTFFGWPIPSFWCATKKGCCCLVAHWRRLNCVGSLKVLNNVTLWTPNLSNELKKKSKKNFLTKLKIMMLIISPKRKNTILEMALKSLILSKLDHQMSKSWKRIVAHELQTTSKFDLLKNWVSDCSAQDRISAKSF